MIMGTARKRRLLILSIVVSSLVVLSVIGLQLWPKQPSAPHVEEETTARRPVSLATVELDFGALPAGTFAEGMADITNESDMPVRYMLKKSTCSCTSTEKSVLVPARGVAKLPVRIHATNQRPGDVTQQLLLTNQNQDTLVISVKYQLVPPILEPLHMELGAVGPGERVVIDLEARKQSEFALKKVGLVFGETDLGAEITEQGGKLAVAFLAPLTSGRMAMKLSAQFVRSDGQTLAASIPVNCTVTNELLDVVEAYLGVVSRSEETEIVRAHPLRETAALDMQRLDVPDGFRADLIDMPASAPGSGPRRALQIAFDVSEDTALGLHSAVLDYAAADGRRVQIPVRVMVLP